LQKTNRQNPIQKHPKKPTKKPPKYYKYWAKKKKGKKQAERLKIKGLKRNATMLITFFKMA
jgi:hypothetical protein